MKRFRRLFIVYSLLASLFLSTNFPSLALGNTMTKLSSQSANQNNSQTARALIKGKQ